MIATRKNGNWNDLLSYKKNTFQLICIRRYYKGTSKSLLMFLINPLYNQRLFIIIFKLSGIMILRYVLLIDYRLCYNVSVILMHLTMQSEYIYMHTGAHACTHTHTHTHRHTRLHLQLTTMENHWQLTTTINSWQNGVKLIGIVETTSCILDVIQLFHIPIYFNNIKISFSITH